MIKKLFKTLFFVIFFFFFFQKSVFALVPYPPTPSQDELDKLREMGRQDELRYGNGGYGPNDPTPDIQPNSQAIIVSPTLIPRLTPTPTVTFLNFQKTETDKTLVDFFSIADNYQGDNFEDKYFMMFLSMLLHVNGLATNNLSLFLQQAK